MENPCSCHTPFTAPKTHRADYINQNTRNAFEYPRPGTKTTEHRHRHERDPLCSNAIIDQPWPIVSFELTLNPKTKHRMRKDDKVRPKKSFRTQTDFIWSIVWGLNTRCVQRTPEAVSANRLHFIAPLAFGRSEVFGRGVCYAKFYTLQDDAFQVNTKESRNHVRLSLTLTSCA